MKNKLTKNKVSYIKSHQQSGLKVGDFVYVVNKNYPWDWKNGWVDGMDKYIKNGKVYKITDDCGWGGFKLNDFYTFPYSSLKNVFDISERVEALLKEL